MSEQFWILLQILGALGLKELFDYLRWTRTQAEVKANTAITAQVQEQATAAKVEARSARTEVQTARAEVQTALEHANATNEKIQALADRPATLLIQGDEEFELMIARCLSQVREERQRRKREMEQQ